MPELAPTRSRGRPRAPKTGRPRRNREEMERLRDACRMARLQGLSEREAVAWLAARGFEGINEYAYRTHLAAASTVDPAARLRRFAFAAPRMHSDAILTLTTIREELWRQYYGIRDPPRADQPGGEEITPTERARITALNAQARARILSTIKDVEPLISAYAEAAVIRERRDSALEAGGGSSASLSALPSSPNSSSQHPPEAWRAVPDPDAPGTLTLVPAK